MSHEAIARLSALRIVSDRLATVARSLTPSLAPPASYADHRALSCSKLLCRVADWFFLHTGRSADFHILAPKRNFARRFLADSSPDLVGLCVGRASRPSFDSATVRCANALRLGLVCGQRQ